MTKNDIGTFSYLVVDDDDMSRDVIGATLTHIGATQVFFAEDASAALHMAQQHRPDFVLLDIYMPEVDGWGLLEQLRRVVPQAAVLMVTGSRQQGDFLQSMQERVDGFCIKPVLPDVMTKALINARLRRPSARSTR
jgi:two-component system copper resistance phosphate regulon response regulator CusR